MPPFLRPLICRGVWSSRFKFWGDGKVAHLLKAGRGIIWLSQCPPPPLHTHTPFYRAMEQRLQFLVNGGGSWGWPYKARHKRPRSTPITPLVFPLVLLFFLNRQSRIFSHIFALRFLPVLPGLEPPTFYLRKKNTKFDAKSE